MEICGEIISYAMHMKREETTLKKQLTEEIRLLENNVNASTMTRSEENKTQLEAIRSRRLEGMVLRSTVKAS